MEATRPEPQCGVVSDLLTLQPRIWNHSIRDFLFWTLRPLEMIEVFTARFPVGKWRTSKWVEETQIAQCSLRISL